MGEVLLQTYTKIPVQGLFFFFSACMQQIVTKQGVTAIWGAYICRVQLRIRLSLLY